MTLRGFSFRSLAGSLAQSIARIPVTNLVFRSYRWGRSEERNIADSLNDMRVNAYRNKLMEDAGQVGCASAAGRARGPSGRTAVAFIGLSRSEAKGIVETYNNDLRSIVAQLFEANPTGGKSYYRQGIAGWYEGRKQWKNPQISLQTVQTARQVAQTDFQNRNRQLLGTPLYRFTGPPPKESECAELMAMGPVPEAVVRQNPVPIHLGCPHSWTALPPNQSVDCSQLWVG